MTLLVFINCLCNLFNFQSKSKYSRNLHWTVFFGN